jgi:probable rRNA maturation factor
MITFETDQKLVPKEHRFTLPVLRKISKNLDEALKGAYSGIVTLTFVDESEIKRLNRMYRGKDKTTDVLSFPSGDPEVSGYLGDVIICLPVAIAQADGDLELELTDLLVHGVLHVLGYDHEEPADAQVMFPLQDAIVAKTL